jgi:hypothetical protein
MRTIRHFIPGTVYHLIWRFVGRTWFITNSKDRACYLRCLGHSIVDTDWRCISYAVMSSHIHLAVIAGLATLASWAIAANTPFAQYINSKHGRVGPVFTRGPKAYAIRPENEGKLIAYIHKNPVRAGVVPLARDSTWSSHRAYLGSQRVPGWLHVDEGLERAGFDECDAFDRWVNETPGESGKVKLGRVRREARKRGAIDVGTPTAGDTTVVPLFVRPAAHIRPDPKLVVVVTAQVLGISETSLCSRSRTAEVLAGRRIAVAAAHTMGIAGADIAAALAISQAAVSQIARAPTDETFAPLVELVLVRLGAADTAVRPLTATT